MSRLTSKARDLALPFVARLGRRIPERPSSTILIVQPDHLGDILLSQLAVRYLRESHADLRLVAVVGPWSREIAEIAWPVDEIVTVSFPGFEREAPASRLAPYRTLYAEARRLSQLGASSAYILRPDGWWAAWLASRCATEVVTSTDRRVAKFATRSVPVSEVEHATVGALRIATRGSEFAAPSPSAQPLSLPSLAEAATRARALLASHGVDGRYLVVHPGSGAPVKEWPVQRWVAVIDELTGEGIHAVITGSVGEAESCARISDGVPGTVSLAGKTPLPVLIEVLRQASVVAGPDSGPLHLAVATGTPTVHLFGPSDPQRYGPWGDPARHRVIRAGWRCSRCGDLSITRERGCGCMLAIDVALVVDTIGSLLAEHGR